MFLSADFLSTFPIQILVIFECKRAILFAQSQTFRDLKFAVKHRKLTLKCADVYCKLIFKCGKA